ncbi:hypothetical protein GCM10023189_23680 [Nibrella saemangeumensis]|uniref:ZIP Zinc transporter n=1 Tax=Nibrella saemangeumensis TaxID=1084526 RepID=A0ABP8MWG8_9BACT
MQVTALAAAFLLAFIHLFAARFSFLGGIPRNRWLSFAGGISIAYVLVHLLPELNRSQQQAIGENHPLTIALEEPVYLVALTGLVAFYGLEHLALTSRARHGESGEETETTPAVFWIHIGSFTLYNPLIGYTLFHLEEGVNLESVLLFTVAMGLHFIVSDFGLREHHEAARYQRIGRWLLSGAILLGAAVGFTTELPEESTAVAIAFLAGGVILNVIKEELPKERQSQFLPFVLGAFGYAVLLLAL